GPLGRVERVQPGRRRGSHPARGLSRRGVPVHGRPGRIHAPSSSPCAQANLRSGPDEGAAMTEQRVTVTITDGVADVRLNRPDKRNALDNAMFAGLITTGERLKTEPGVRAVVLSGEGPDFCAGLDFGAFQAMRDGERLSLLVDLPPAEGPARA